MTAAASQAGDPPFRSVAIVGAGLIGGSLALAIRRAWPGAQVAGVDRGEALDAARLLVAFDRLDETLAPVDAADLVVLAAPVRQNIALLGEVSRRVATRTVVTDVGSTKRAVVEAARTHDGLIFIGGHPLAGAARAGLGLARADLFAGRPWVLTPDAGVDSVALDRLSTFVRGFDADVHVLSADEHDRLLAFLSHLPQLTASALMHIVGTNAGDHIALAGPGLADTTRLASSPVDIWRDICATNADDIRPALAALIDSLSTLRDRLDDEDALPALFESAQSWRERIQS